MQYLFLIFFVMTTWACSDHEIKVALPHQAEPTREELRSAMRFHGILVAKQDENHEWYFMRGKKRCPLFAYLKKQNNRTGKEQKNNS